MWINEYGALVEWYWWVKNWCPVPVPLYLPHIPLRLAWDWTGASQWEAGNWLLEPWYGLPVTALGARVGPKHLIFQQNKMWFLWCLCCYRVWTLQKGKTRIHSSCWALQRWPKSGVCCCRLHTILSHLWCCGCEGISHIQVLPLLHQGNQELQWWSCGKYQFVIKFTYKSVKNVCLKIWREGISLKVQSCSYCIIFSSFPSHRMHQA